MNSSNIILLLIVAFILYQLFTKINEPFEDINNETSEELKLNEVMDDVEEWERENEPCVHQSRFNKKFVDAQYHKDYQDIINTFGLIVPTKRQIFNVGNRPLKYSEPSHAEANKMILAFLDKLNIVVKDKVMMPTEHKNGWNDYQADLGTNILYDGKNNNYKNVYLVGITKVRKYEIDDEAKYSTEFVIQKEDVNDQMVLKVDFVQDNKELVNEDNLFREKFSGPIRIEQIFMVGVLSNVGLYDDFDPEKNHFTFNEMEVNNMTDPKYIQGELMKHYDNKMKEMEYRTALLDEEGRIFNQNLFNKIHRYPSYQMTQTIFDDFAGNREFR